MMWIYLFWFVIACIVIAKSSSLLVKSLARIARFFRLSEFIIASVLMAFASSLPELFVGVSAALSKAPSLVLGNIIGANIADLTLIIGIPIVLAGGIKFKDKIMREDSFYMILVSVLVLFLMLDKTLSRIDGVILLGVFVLYLIGTLEHRKKFVGVKNHSTKLFKNIIIFVLALLALFISARFIIKYAILISDALNLPQILIGLFLISIGTTLPELVFGISAVLKKHKDMALGNIFGSVVFNAAFVLGLSALIYPITSEFFLFLISAIFLIFVSFLFWIFLETDKKVSLREGIVLIFFYVVFIIVELTVTGII